MYDALCRLNDAVIRLDTIFRILCLQCFQCVQQIQQQKNNIPNIHKVICQLNSTMINCGDLMPLLNALLRLWWSIFIIVC